MELVLAGPTHSATVIKRILVGAVGIAIVAALLPGTLTPPTSSAASTRVASPLRFEPNRGQTSSRFDFIGRADSYRVALRAAGPTIVGAGGAVLGFELLGGDRDAVGSTSDRLGSRTSYLMGGDERRWIHGLPNFARVSYAEVYPGIDVTYLAGDSGALRHDFVVDPGANADQIVERYPMAHRVEITPEGLTVRAEGLAFDVLAPVAYQTIAGERRDVDVAYRRVDRRSIGYELGPHDGSKPLVIDPTVAYSTYLGGAEIDTATAVAVDSLDRPVMVGRTNSLDFPTNSARQDTLRGNNDVFVSKYTIDGSNLVWSTYIGGSDHDLGLALTLAENGAPYVSGMTCSQNYPTKKALQKSFAGGCDVMVTKLTGDGQTIVWSTYLGGRGLDRVDGVELDPSGGVYMVGETNSDRPVRSQIQGSFGGGLRDAFVSKISADGRRVVYFTYLGGKAIDRGRGITVDGRGNAYVTGFTNSGNFPVKNAIQRTKHGPKDAEDFADTDAFVTKINPTGTKIGWSTFFGGRRGDAGFQIKVAPDKKLWIGGRSQSTDLRTTRNAYQREQGGGYEGDGMLFKMNRRGTRLFYSTYLGAEGHDRIFALAVGADDAPVVSGRTDSLEFPLVNPVQSGYGGGSSDGYVTRFTPGGRELEYSTYYGGTDFDRVFGIDTDASGSVYLVGQTKSEDFPLTNPHQDTFGGGFSDAFLVKVVR